MVLLKTAIQRAGTSGPPCFSLCPFRPMGHSPQTVRFRRINGMRVRFDSGRGALLLQHGGGARSPIAGMVPSQDKR